MSSENVCRICEQFPPAGGGLASAMLHLSLAQHELGHGMTVITRAASGDCAYDKQIPFRVIRVPGGKSYRFGWKAYEAYRTLNHSPDIVHTHGPSAFYYLLRKRKKDASLVHTLHAVRKYQYRRYAEYLSDHKQNGRPAEIEFSPWRPKIFKELMLERVIVRGADHLCLVADYFKEKLMNYYGIDSGKTTTVYNGSAFTLDPIIAKRNRTQELPESRLVLFVGRFDWHKRVDLLIHAFSEILKSEPNRGLMLVGDGEQRRAIQKLVEAKGLQHCITFAGWVDAETVGDFYRQADCICLPSIVEGLPKVLLEAMSCGVPVVASSNPAHEELLRNGRYGALVEGSDPEKWAKSILKALSKDASVEQRAREARGLLDSDYRWHHVAQRVKHAYENALAK